VVAWPPVYDWLTTVPRLLRPLVYAMVRWEPFMRWSIRLRMRFSPILRHVVAQALFLQGSTDLVDVPRWLLAMNAKHVHSERVTQDVLLLGGEADTFQSPTLLDAQRHALTQARSVQIRIFTAADFAQNHCQMGNLPLAAGYIASWLDELRPHEPRQFPIQCPS
jgi:hypothetical protein